MLAYECCLFDRAEMNFTCQYTLDDCQKAFRAHYQHRAFWRWMLRAAIGMGGLLSLLGLWLIFKWPNNPVPFAPLLLVGAFWFWIGFGGNRRRFVRSQFLKNPCYREEYKIEANEEGIRLDYRIGRTEATWQAFTHYLETDEMFLLYRSPHQFHILPKRIFQPAQLDEFRELLKHKVGG